MPLLKFRHSRPYFLIGLLALGCAQPAMYAQWELANSRLKAPSGAIRSEQTITPPVSTVLAPSALTAEAPSPDITALASGLLNKPELIFGYVLNNITYEHYYGSKKGAAQTLLEGGGNDYDQCALLVALLTVAAQNTGASWTISYQKGSQIVPYGDGTGNDFVSWTGVSPTPFAQQTTWNGALQSLGYPSDPFAGDSTFESWDLASKEHFILAADFSVNRGWPSSFSYDGPTKSILLERVWVKFVRGGTTFLLDPSFKRSVRATPFASLGTAMGYNRSTLLANAGAASPANAYTSSGISETGIQTTLSGYTNALVNSIKSSGTPNLSVDDFLGRAKIVGTPELSALPTATPLTTQGTVTDLGASIPAASRVTLTFTIGPGTGYSAQATTLNVSDLAGQRVSMTFSHGVVTLWQEDTALLTVNTGSATTASVPLATQFNYPTSYPGSFNAAKTATYNVNDAYAYAIVYGFDPNGSQLRQRQRKLDGFIRSARALMSVPSGSLDLSTITDATLKRQCITETLNVMGLTWLYNTRLSERVGGDIIGADMLAHHRLGRVSQEASYYIDVYQQFSGAYSLTGVVNDKNSAFQMTGFFDSAHEHGVIEQMQPSADGAVSTVKILALANDSTDAQHNQVYRADATSWPTVQNLLVNYTANFKTATTSAINAGATFILPKNARNPLGISWNGFGYVQLSSTSIDMIIQPGAMSGGFNSDPGNLTSVTNPAPPGAAVTGGGATQPALTSPTFNTPDPTAQEPVDMNTGAFLVENEDLSLGEAEPRGLHLVRSYNSNSINFDPTGLGPGWTHSYNLQASLRSADDAGIGESTPCDMAAYLAAVYAAIDIQRSNSSFPARDWTLTALLANWAVNNLKNNAVSFTLGKESMQFIRKPDGTYQPPAGSTLALTKNGSGDYSLTERFGRTFLFSNASALSCTGITDFDGKAMTLTYDSAHGNRLSKVTDASSRTLTFAYTGARLSSVTLNNGTSTGSVGYGTTDGNGNLNTYTDPESKIWTFSYTGNLITQTQNPDAAVIIQNTYDAQNRVVTQLNQGLAARNWSFFWSGVRNVEQSPLAQQTTYFYDRRGRSLGSMDGDGNRNQLVYDGQDHVVQSTTPEAEVTTCAYDANQNLTQITDPLGATITNTYDSSQRLTQVDKVDSDITVPTRTSKLVYNSGNLTNRPDSTSDPRGVTTKYTYEPATSAAAGKPTTITRTSAEGNRLTTCKYDTVGFLKEIDTPNPAGGVFSESYAFNAAGDLQTFTDKNGNVFSYQYNLRHQKTSDTGPGDGYSGNPDYSSTVTKYIYSNEGNLQYLVDPLGHTVKNTWSATGKLLSTQAGLQETAPNTYDTTNAITTVTNNYDARDWLQNSVGPVNSQTTAFAYYNSGRVMTVTDPNSYVTTFTYDANGRQTAVSDLPDGVTSRVVSQTYNARGQSDSASDALGKTTLFSYNAWGDRLSLKNRLGNTYTFAYEKNGLPNTQTTPLGYATAWAYNDRNLLKTLTKPSTQQTTYSYDTADRVSSLTEKLGSTQLGAVSFAYDANANRTTITENGVSITRTFDPYNRVKSYTDSRGNVIQYHYYANGLLKSITYPYPANRTVTYTYDSLNRLYQVTDWAGNITTFGWRADGLLSTITRPNFSTRTLTYDDAGHLKRIEERSPSGMMQTMLNYKLDAAGRITSTAQFPVPVSAPPALAAMTYDTDNRLATFGATPGTCTFDADGNLTSGPLGNAWDGTGGFGTYTFDQRNRLTANPGQTRVYDAENNLLSRTDATGTTYHVYAGGAMAQVLTREPPNGTKYYYVYGAGQLLYEISEGGPAPTGLVYYHFDHNGNTIALSNSTGQVVQRNEYSPYGQLTQASANYDTPFLFAGALGVQTSGDGLLYMRARYYNPRMGRFLNADPIGFSGGSNWYAYANGNPVMFNDPFGLEPQSTASSPWGAALNGGNQFAERFNQNLLNSGQSLVDFVGATAGYLYSLADSNSRGGAWSNTVDEFSKLGSAKEWSQYGSYLASPQGLADTAFMIDATLALGPKGSNCFPAGTHVSTSHGDVNIEDLKVGDLVFAYDFAAGAVVESHVIETPRHFTYYWMSVTVDGETIRATRGHRFWVESEKSWVEAVDLKAGMTVRLSDGRIAAITAVSLATLAQSEATYNLEIENQHTYFVGQHHVLVHNPYPLSPQYPPATQVGQNFQFNFDTSLGFRNSRAAGVERARAAGLIGPTDIGHHINSVQTNANLAAEPSNIAPEASTASHLETHGGNWRNPTSGSLRPGC